jgi:oligoribonuclease NrnB/cAMP/cGMP phosphodiesterase (DHH superfamily)
MTKVFFHSVDCDGICSAAIINNALLDGFSITNPQIEFIGINYGQPFPWDNIEKGETVYMVDFSLQPFENMVRLNNLADLTWIDHHKTTIEARDSFGCALQFKGIQKIGLGACALVWEWFHNTKLPRTVELLAKYDVFDHSHPDTLPFQYGINTLECASDPLDPTWQQILDDDTHLFPHLLGQGRAILKYIEKDNARKAKTLCFDHEIDGLKVLAANFGPSNSKFFDSKWDPKQYDVMMFFSWHKHHWTVSLYTDKPEVDVGEVAKNRGGGGHKRASCFRVKSLKEIGL